MKIKLENNQTGESVSGIMMVNFETNHYKFITCDLPKVGDDLLVGDKDGNFIRSGEIIEVTENENDEKLVLVNEMNESFTWERIEE